MRLTLTSLLTLVLLTALKAQNDQWLVYDLDSQISIGLPGEVFEMDTIIRNESLYQIYSEFEGARFIVQKVSYKKNSRGRYVDLPADSDELEKYYQGVIKGIMNTAFGELQQTTTIEIGGLTGYELLLSNENEKPIRIVRFLLIENKLINMIYSDETNLDLDIAELFYGSIDITDTKSVNQHIGTSREFLLGELVGELIGYVIVIVLIIFIVKMASKRSKGKRSVRGDNV